MKEKRLYSKKLVDGIVLIVIAVLVFLLAYRNTVVAITLTAFFAFLNLMRLDGKIKDVEKELEVMRKICGVNATDANR